MEPIELWHHIAPTLAATGEAIFMLAAWLSPAVFVPYLGWKAFRATCDPAPISDREAGLPRSVLEGRDV